MKTKTIGLILMILMFPVFGGAQERTVWSLEDCVNHALENNLRIQQQKLGVEVARENLQQSQANRLDRKSVV